jgi:hypothetical protein
MVASSERLDSLCAALKDLNENRLSKASSSRGTCVQQGDVRAETCVQQGDVRAETCVQQGDVPPPGLSKASSAPPRLDDL